MRIQKTCLVVLAVVITLATAAPLAADQPIDAVLAFNPDAYHIVAGPVELVVPMDAAVPFVETAIETRVDDKVTPSGTRLFSGALVAEGALVNLGGGTLVVRHTDGEQTLLEPGQGLVVRTAPAIAAAPAPCDVCSVSCGAGYYACCNRPGWFSCAKCKCVKNDTEEECDSGGPGAKSCSVGDALTAAEPSFFQVDTH